MDLRELNWFLVLARTENVTAAARELNVSQPTLSRALGRLERRLGVPLFDRNINRLSINRYGEVFRAHALRAVSEVSMAQERIGSLIDPLGGMVTVGFLHSLGEWLVPEIVTRYRDAFPQARFELRGDAADSILDDVHQGRVDVGFVSPGPSESALSWVPFGSEPLFLMVPRRHRLAGRKQVRLRELAEEEFVVLAPHFGLRQVTDRLLSTAGVTPRLSVVATEVSTLRSLVARGAGVAVLPAPSAGTADAEDGALLRIVDVAASRPVGMVTSPLAVRTAPAARFIDFAVGLAPRLVAARGGVGPTQIRVTQPRQQGGSAAGT